MGQVFSSSSSTSGSDESPRRERVPKHVDVLVDLDNIAFYMGRLDQTCLLSRVQAIHDALGPRVAPQTRAGAQGGVRATREGRRASSRNVEYFCNPATYGFLQRVRFPALAAVRMSDANRKDSADHLLLQRFNELFSERRTTRRDSAILVVTHDKILARQVRYFGPFASTESDLLFGSFGKDAASCNALEVSPAQRFNLAFNDRADLDAFMRSLSAFFRQSAQKIKGDGVA